MPQKSRFKVEEKKQIVESCIRGNASIRGSARKYGINNSTITRWIRLYEIRGIEGLKPSAESRKYGIEVKVQAVNEYMSGSVSLSEICRKYDISDISMLHKWIKRYTSHGDFKQLSTGGAIYMTKGRKTTLDERIDVVSYCISNNKDYLKAVEQYGVSYQQIYDWVRKYEKDGVIGLADNRGKGKEKVSMSEIEKLRAQLKLKDAENLRLQMENEILKKLEEIERGLGHN